MKREQLLRLLQNYQPIPEEVQFKTDMLAFIKEHEDCFERTLEIGHITASAWLLSKDHSHALLLHHKKLSRWFQLGGHCDGDSDVLAVAIKEAQEESGIMGIEPVEAEPAIFDIDIHWIPEHKEVKGHWHYDVRFLLHVITDEQVVQNHESNELRWISRQERAQAQRSHALALCDGGSVTRMFKKWLARR